MNELDLDTLIFFVPGIMGSTLCLADTAPDGTSINEEVWGKDIWRNVGLFRSHGSKLISSKIQPGKVIDHFIVKRRLLPLQNHDVYGTILNFCTDKNQGLGLTEEKNFFPFAYDWRADNRQTAAKLAEFIHRQDPNNHSRLRFIAHSMGGIVTRLLLLQYPSIAARTDLFFQIASPIMGSAKAYFALKKYPNFDPNFTWLWKKTAVNKENYGDLVKTVEKFASLYQLLPPRSSDILYDLGGNSYSALDPDIWQDSLKPLVNNANLVHQQLAQPLKINGKLICVYSNQKVTPTDYVVDPLENYNIIEERKAFVYGDDTVTCASAFAYSQPQQRYLIKTSPGDHLGLCNNPKVHQLLKQEFS